MGFLDTLLGRTKPVQPKLDDLFALPSAAITLDAGAGFKPTGSGSVCFRPVEGRSFSDVQKDVQDLLNSSSHAEGGLPVEVTKDDYGFTWLVSSRIIWNRSSASCGVSEAVGSSRIRISALR